MTSIGTRRQKRNRIYHSERGSLNSSWLATAQNWNKTILQWRHTDLPYERTIAICKPEETMLFSRRPFRKREIRKNILFIKHTFMKAVQYASTFFVFAFLYMGFLRARLQRRYVILLSPKVLGVFVTHLKTWLSSSFTLHSLKNAWKIMSQMRWGKRATDLIIMPVVKSDCTDSICFRIGCMLAISVLYKRVMVLNCSVDFLHLNIK